MYCKNLPFLDIGIVECYFNIEIELLLQNTKIYIQKRVFLTLPTDLWPLVTWQNMQIKVNDMVQKKEKTFIYPMVYNVLW